LLFLRKIEIGDAKVPGIVANDAFHIFRETLGALRVDVERQGYLRTAGLGPIRLGLLEQYCSPAAWGGSDRV